MAELQMPKEVQGEYGFRYPAFAEHYLGQAVEVPGGAVSCPHTTCKHRGLKDRHHRYWPAHWYTTSLEKRFRNHPDNIEHNICRCFHDLEHLKKPPKKPSQEEMRRFLGERR